MVAIRHFTVQSLGFNGTSVPSPITAGWSKPWTDANQNILNRLVDAGRIGRFTPEILGRRAEAHSLVRVWTDGPIVEGDGIEVRGSLDDTEALPVNAIRRALTPITNSIESSETITLAPYDDLCVTVIGDGDQTTLHITVTDFSPAEYMAWLVAAGGGGGTCCTVGTRSIVGGDQTLDGWVGALFLHTTLTTDAAVLTLPDSADLAVGASVFIARETAGSWFRVVASAGDTINGAGGPEGVEIRNSNQGELFRLSAGGRWVSTAFNGLGELLAAANAVAGTNVPIPKWQGDRELIANFTADGTLVLPALAEIAIGQRLIIVRNPAGFSQIRVTVNNPGAEGLNAIAGGSAWLEGPGSTMWIERVVGGWAALASHELGVLNVPETISSAGATIQPWAGDKFVRLAIVAGGATQLPLIADTPEGSRLWVTRSGGTTQHRIEAQGGDIFNRVANGGVNLVLNAPMLEIVQVGGRWETVGAPIAADETEVVGGALVLTEGWVGLRCFTITAAVLLTLPAAATLSVGTQALILPSIAGTSVSGGASNISFGGALGATIAPAIDEPILLIWNGTAWAGV